MTQPGRAKHSEFMCMMLLCNKAHRRISQKPHHILRHTYHASDHTAENLCAGSANDDHVVNNIYLGATLAYHPSHAGLIGSGQLVAMLTSNFRSAHTAHPVQMHPRRSREDSSRTQGNPHASGKNFLAEPNVFVPFHHLLRARGPMTSEEASSFFPSKQI